MATTQAIATKRAIAIEAINTSVEGIVGKLNDALPSEQMLEGFTLDVRNFRNDDPLLQAANQMAIFATFLQDVNSRLTALLETVKANQKLADELIDLQAKLNDPGKPETDPESEIENVTETEKTENEGLTHVNILDDSDDTKSQSEETEKADSQPHTAVKRGRPKR